MYILIDSPLPPDSNLKSVSSFTHWKDYRILKEEMYILMTIARKQSPQSVSINAKCTMWGGKKMLLVKKEM